MKISLGKLERSGANFREKDLLFWSTVLCPTHTFNNAYRGMFVRDGGKVGGKQSFVGYVRGVSVVFELASKYCELRGILFYSLQC